MQRLDSLLVVLIVILSLFLAGCLAVGEPHDEDVSVGESTEDGKGDSPDIQNGAGAGDDTAASPAPAEKPSKEPKAAGSETPVREPEAEGDAHSELAATEEGDGSSTRAGKAEDKKEATEWETASSSRTTPSVSGLQAGFADDNKQFNYFLGFLKTYANTADHFELDISERIVMKIVDHAGKSLPNARVSVKGGGRELTSGLSYADGSFYFFPSEFSPAARYQIRVEFNQQVETLEISREGRRDHQIAFGLSRPDLRSVPLDLLFIMDTTGSMGEEIQRLKTTIELINLNLSSLSSQPRVRFGMVLYKDIGDEYITKVIPMTSDLDAFQNALNRVEASGGGDTPEDLQAALHAAMTRITWNTGGVRLSFVITDAPPHLDYPQAYTYVHAAREAKQSGIKIFTVGTGGLDLNGEYILRQLSQYTAAKYIFLTYGEEGESSGGQPGSVSHHTGANFQTDKLEAIIIRFAKEELQYLTDRPIEDAEEYFEARQISTEVKEQTLAKLFTLAGQQLIDYASYRIPDQTPTAVLPIVPATSELELTGEYFTEQLIFTLSREQAFQKSFRMVERKDLQAVLKEMELQMSGLVEDEQAVKVGALLGADILVTGKLYLKLNEYELFMKLLRVETGEILSITKARLDKKLGL